MEYERTYKTEWYNNDIKSIMLERVKDIVCKEREDSYGDIITLTNYVARLWSEYFNWHINPEDIPICMILLKIARQTLGEPKGDNLIDIAGYAACAYEMLHEKNKEKYNETD